MSGASTHSTTLRRTMALPGAGERRQARRDRASVPVSRAGLGAGALALSFLWAASKLSPYPEFPPLALAERVIRLTPGGIATFFIDALDRNALRLLAVGAIIAFLFGLAVIARITAPAGMVRPNLAGTLATGSFVLASYASPMLREPVATVAMSLVAGIMYATSLRWLAEPVPDAGQAADPSRRRALVVIGASAAGLAVGGTLLGRIARKLRGPDTSVAVRDADDAAVVPVRDPFPEIAGLSPEVTSADDHYVVDIDLFDPIVEAGTWTLSVNGLVRRPLRLSFDDLQRRFRLVEQYSVLTCVSNEIGGELVGNSLWRGVRLGDVLDAAEVKPGAVDVVFRCADGYTSSLPIDAARHPTAILAIAQNRQPLAWEHGFPCRLRAPGYYGVKNAKWLTAIEVVGRDHVDYWTARGWSDVAAVRTQSRIDTLGKDLRARTATWIAGVAWAGLRGVSKVEVSVDGGRSWQDATLRAPLSPASWVQWAYRWQPERPGSYQIMCRATDGDGRRQEEAVRPPHPSGATGYHEVFARVD